MLSYLSSFFLTAASAAEPAQADGAQIWGCDGVGDGHVPGGTTSFFPWCKCDTIRAFTISPLEALWSLDWGKSGFGKWTPDQIIHTVMALWSTRVSSARERMRATSVDWGIGMVDKAPNPAGVPQQLSSFVVQAESAYWYWNCVEPVATVRCCCG